MNAMRLWFHPSIVLRFNWRLHSALSSAQRLCYSALTCDSTGWNGLARLCLVFRWEYIFRISNGIRVAAPNWDLFIIRQMFTNMIFWVTVSTSRVVPYQFSYYSCTRLLDCNSRWTDNFFLSRRKSMDRFGSRLFVVPFFVEAWFQ